MSLRMRVGGLLALLALLLLGRTLALVLTLHDYDVQRDQIRDKLQPAAFAARALLTSLVNQETGERGYLITGEESFLDPYRSGQTSFNTSLRKIEKAFPDDPEIANHVADVRRSVTKWQVIGVQPEIAARRAGHIKMAQSLVVQGLGKQAFDDVRRQVGALQTTIDERADGARITAASSFDSLKTGLLASGVLLLALLLLIAVLLRRWVLLPVNALRASMRAVASGQLDRPVQVSGPPEVAAIGQDAEAMRRRIVFELDTARAATEALEQHSPVVSQLRSELAAGTVAGLVGVRVSGALHPAEGVLAGDWWEVMARSGGSTALLVADVAGHGAEAGLVALRFKQRITALLRTDLDLLTAFVAAAENLDDDPEKFLSCVLVEVDPVRRTLRWINAGHSAAVVARRVGTDVTLVDLAPTGPLIGALEHHWSVSQTTLQPGDLLLAMTDGVVEARSNNEEFGIEGVHETLRGLRSWSPQGTVTEIVEAVRLFADDWRRDDVTLVALELAAGG